MSVRASSALPMDSSDDSMDSQLRSQGSRIGTPNIMVSDVQMDAQRDFCAAIVADSLNELAHSSSVCVKSVTKQQTTVTLCIGKLPTCTVDISGSASGIMPSALAKKADGSTLEGDYKVSPNPTDRLQKMCRFLLLFLASFQAAVLKHQQILKLNSLNEIKRKNVVENFL
uniref:Uncharacterized protein n=1 Tax=Glossina austeni TaxID=7395 RepID=A0A1A9UIA9_GLOAU